MTMIKQWRATCVALAIPFSTGNPAMADTLPSDGTTLLNVCNTTVRMLDEQATPSGDSAMEFGYCLGFLEATRNMMMILESVKGNQKTTCFPTTGINNGQTARIVVKYLKDHPADLNQDKTLLTMLALRDAYPCK